MATVTIDADRWERVRKQADMAYSLAWMVEQEFGRSTNQDDNLPCIDGDLDDVSPEPHDAVIRAMNGDSVCHATNKRTQ